MASAPADTKWLAAAEESEDEGTADYRPGGYHPVKVGEVYNSRYKIVAKHGWGHFSTVWKAQDISNGTFVALKIVKSAQHYTEAALDEVQILEVIAANDPLSIFCCCHLLDHFRHRDVCMVFEQLGSNLLDLIKLYNYRGIPIPIVKYITKQILIGLDYLHTTCQLIHTGLLCERIDPKKHKIQKKNEPKFPIVHSSAMPIPSRTSVCDFCSLSFINKAPSFDFVVSPSVQHTEVCNSHGTEEIDWAAFNIKIIDFGNANWVHKRFTNDIQTRQYRAPEIILGNYWDTTVDLWSLACMVFELSTGDLLFEPHAGETFTKEDDHLAQIIELLGEFPFHLVTSSRAKEFFNERGQLRYIPQEQLRHWPLNSEKYHVPEQEAESMASFMLGILTLDNSKRASARTCLDHPWLLGVPTPTCKQSTGGC